MVQGDGRLMDPVMDSTHLAVQYKAVKRKCQTLPHKADVCILMPMTRFEQIFQVCEATVLHATMLVTSMTKGIQRVDPCKLRAASFIEKFSGRGLTKVTKQYELSFLF